MKKFVAVLLCALSLCSQAVADVQSYLRVSGLSAHSTSGNNAINAGLGYERDIAQDWSLIGGFYRNSEWNYSWYAGARYAFYTEGDWNIGVGAGAVTGYKSMSPMPMLMPDVCYKWACFLAAPKLEQGGSNVVAVNLRIPIK